MIAADQDFEVFSVAGFRLDCGAILPETRLTYRVLGDVHSRPPLLTCSAFSQTFLDLTWLAGDGEPLDPARRPVIRTEFLGNGRSSSPSNTPAPFAGPDFPAFTIADGVRLQAMLLDHLGVARVGCVIGASMGGQQAAEWAVRFPDRVGGMIAIAANLRTTTYGRLFLHTVGSALRNAPDFAAGRYAAPPLLGLSRLSETWAPFALSPRFFSTGRWQAHPDMSGESLDDFLAKWRTRYHAKDANDLLSHLSAWSRHDVAPGKDLADVGLGVAVPMLFLPSSTDLYFHPDDIADQARHFPGARVEVIDSLSGHAAAFGREPEDRMAIMAAIERFLVALGL